MGRGMFSVVFLLLAGMLGASPPAQAEPRHGVALHGEPKYPADFTHFDYVNPDAPVGGTLKLASQGGVDSFNPFIIKGSPAPGVGLVYESLMTASADEPFTQYGLLAETVDIADDRRTVTFVLREAARFSDGTPVTSADVEFSFNTLKADGSPLYRYYYANVESLETPDERTVVFHLAEGVNPELALIIGQVPVLSKAYWADRDFTDSTLDIPLGSGPYVVERFETGRFVVYKRNPDYWGWDLPVMRGQYNFERLRFDEYRDANVAVEALKSGAYDFRLENVAKTWATGYDIPARREGVFKTDSFPHHRTQGMQGFAFNLRRPQFQDPRVRRALALAFDFEWSNENLFYGQYTRTRSYFDNSELAAVGLPGPLELDVLEPLRGQIPDEVFTTEYQPPSTAGEGGLRANLREALTLLQEAGWTFKDRKLVNAQTGQPFAFEILLVQPDFERIVLPYIQSLERLGIDARARTVDQAQYINRLNEYDFDMVVSSWAQSESPGNEQREFWGTEAAQQPGSRNVTGLADPAVDALIEQLIAAPDRETLVARVRALDRVLQWQHLVVPHWHLAADRLAYWDKFGKPEVVPDSGVQVVSTWWIDTEKAAVVEPRQGGR